MIPTCVLLEMALYNCGMTKIHNDCIVKTDDTEDTMVDNLKECEIIHCRWPTLFSKNVNRRSQGVSLSFECVPCRPPVR